MHDAASTSTSRKSAALSRGGRWVKLVKGTAHPIGPEEIQDFCTSCCHFQLKTGRPIRISASLTAISARSCITCRDRPACRYGRSCRPRCRFGGLRRGHWPSWRGLVFLRSLAAHEWPALRRHHSGSASACPSGSGHKHFVAPVPALVRHPRRGRPPARLRISRNVTGDFAKA